VLDQLYMQYCDTSDGAERSLAEVSDYQAYEYICTTQSFTACMYIACITVPLSSMMRYSEMR
jgi:hypothetical protein